MEHGVDRVDHSLKPFIAREVKWWTWKRVLLAAVLVPVIVAVLPIWYSIRQSSSSGVTGAQQNQQALQGTGDHSQKAL